jgi:hypothetical protein
MAQDEMGFDGSLAPFDFAFPAHRARSALPPKADIGEHDGNVRFVPKRTLGGASGVSPKSSRHLSPNPSTIKNSARNALRCHPGWLTLASVYSAKPA